MKTLLRQAREAKGLKISDVSKLLQIDLALVSKFESGQRKPTKAQVLKLMELLEIDPETMLTLWLKEKILHEISGEEFALEALNAAKSELAPNENVAEKEDPMQKLFEEMDALKSKFEHLRGKKS